MPKFNWRKKKQNGQTVHICHHSSISAVIFDADPGSELFKDYRATITWYHPDPEMQGEGFSIHTESQPSLDLAMQEAEREMIRRVDYPPMLMIPLLDE